jgi:hypothetical protein
VYIAGTEPVGTCPLHGGRTGVTNVAGWDTGSGNPVASADSPSEGGAKMAPAAVARRAARQTSAEVAQQAPPAPPRDKDTRKPEEKKSLLRRLLGVFK